MENYIIISCSDPELAKIARLIQTLRENRSVSGCPFCFALCHFSDFQPLLKATLCVCVKISNVHKIIHCSNQSLMLLPLIIFGENTPPVPLT